LPKGTPRFAPRFFQRFTGLACARNTVTVPLARCYAKGQHATLARVVAVDVPHHVTQRGNNRQPGFLDDLDRRSYCKLLAQWSRRCGLRVLGYCFMTNHVHLVVVPERADALARGLGRAHFLYAREFHLHHNTSGHLWQNRFFSTTLDARRLFTALRYVDLNPVRAGIVHQAEAYQWSSAQAHVTGCVRGTVARFSLRMAPLTHVEFNNKTW